MPQSPPKVIFKVFVFILLDYLSINLDIISLPITTDIFYGCSRIFALFFSTQLRNWCFLTSSTHFVLQSPRYTSLFPEIRAPSFLIFFFTNLSSGYFFFPFHCLCSNFAILITSFLSSMYMLHHALFFYSLMQWLLVLSHFSWSLFDYSLSFF